MPQGFSPFNWGTWGPKYQQTEADARKALGLADDPTLANIAQGVNKLGEFFEGTGWADGSPGISQAVPGNDGFGDAFFPMPAQLANADTMATAAAASSATAASNSTVLTAWINGSYLPFGYLESGKLSAPELFTEWGQFDGLPQDGYNYSTALADAGISGRRDILYNLHRRVDAPLFLVCYQGDESLVLDPTLPDFRSVDPSTQMPGETDVAFLNRVYPSKLWINPIFGVPVAGTSVVQSDGVQIYYFYSPYALSSAPLKRMWDYIPSSGPPYRNGIDDFIRILTLLPLQF